MQLLSNIKMVFFAQIIAGSTTLLGYTRPVVSGRADKRNMKPKSAVWFVYRVA